MLILILRKFAEKFAVFGDSEITTEKNAESHSLVTITRKEGKTDGWMVNFNSI
jgi:hypothetical protein